MPLNPNNHKVSSALNRLVGRVITSVKPVPFEWADEGLRIVLDNGTVLDIGFSGLEGTISVNGEDQGERDDWTEC